MAGNMSVADDLRSIVADLGNAKSCIYNANPRFRRKHQMKLAKAFAGGGRYKLAAVGDSQTTGAGAGSGADFCTGAKTKSYPANLAKLFRNAGFIVSEDSVMGDNRLPTAGTASVTLYDPKVAFAGSGWARNSPMTLGGNTFINSTTTDILSFTPAVAGQNIDVYYCTLGGGGTFRISDAATPMGADVATSGGPGFIKASRTRALSANAINIARLSGGACYINVIDHWANDTQISIYNCGAYGVGSVDWTGASQPYSSLNAQSALAADLIVIQLGANEVRDAVAVATYKANLQTCITAWKANGSDIVLVVPFPSASTDETWAPYILALYQLAFDNNLPLINLYDRFGSRTVSMSVYQSEVHLLAEGYTDVAFAIWELVRPQ